MRDLLEHSAHWREFTRGDYSYVFNYNSKIEENVPYRVVRNDAAKYKISFNTNGGNAISAITNNDNYIPASLPTPSKEGSNFLGWYADSDLKTEINRDEKLTSDVTLYAKWRDHEHTYATEWSYDSDYHYHPATCSHSSEVADRAAHEYGTTGTERYTCTICGYVNTQKKENIEAVEKTKNLIDEIGEVEYTIECKNRIETAKSAYYGLTDEQKKEISVEELKILKDAEAKYQYLETEYTKAIVAARAVVEKINAIGDVKYVAESKEKIDAARSAYNELTDYQKTFVTAEQYKVLTDAESKYAKLEADDEAAKDAIAKINAIGEVNYTTESKAKIDAAGSAYNALTADQKKLVDQSVYNKLVEAEATYAKLKADDEAAKAAIAKINAIGKVEYTTESKAKIDAARSAYNALTSDQKALIEANQVKILTDAESEYAKLKQDYEIAQEAVNVINSIGEVEYTTESKSKIDAARSAYNGLTADQRVFVTAEQYKVLTDAESKYAKLKADDEAAKDVIAKINAIGDVAYTEESKNKIDTAREAYEALTADQKALVSESDLKTLTEAEKAYAKCKSDYEEAQKVVTKINAIGKAEYTTESSNKIDTARKAYNALTASQKAIITKEQYKVLTDAESLYAKLKEASEYKANGLALNSKFSINMGKTIKVKWGKVEGADGYDVYMAYCGKGKVKGVKSTKSLSATIKKLNKKAINQKGNIKCYVVAYKMVKGKKQQIGKTNIFHAVGSKNKSLTEPKNIKLNKSSYVLEAGKKATIKASIVKKNKKRAVIAHTEKFRYATSDERAAVVSKDGSITAKAKGTCDIYVYAINGCTKKVTVTVK